MYKWMAVWIKTARLATCIFFPCPFTIRMMLTPGTFQVMLLFLFCFVSSCVGGGGGVAISGDALKPLHITLIVFCSY